MTDETLPGKVALAEALFRIGALRFGRFTLASGKESSYYLDLRMIPSYPDVYTLVVDEYRDAVERIGEDSFDVIAGVATAGVTISSPLAFVLKKPMIYVRKEEKGHGLGRQVEGASHPGWRALLVDDLATTGGSVISAVQALRKGGCIVKEALVLVDRLEGGKANLAAEGVRLDSCVNVRELVEILSQGKMIPKKDYEKVIRQMEGGKR